MIKVVQPSQISGVINAPTSKSSMQRACAAALLHAGTTIIRNPGNSVDMTGNKAFNNSIQIFIAGERCSFFQFSF